MSLTGASTAWDERRGEASSSRRARAALLKLNPTVSLEVIHQAIEGRLDRDLPRAYTPDLFRQKTAAVFQHVYDAHFGAGLSVYPV